MRTFMAVLVGLVLAAAGVSLFVWLLWWLWSRREEQDIAEIEIEVGELPSVDELQAVEAGGEGELLAVETRTVADVEQPAVEAKVREETPEQDDLKRIEGIGPKISSVLQQAGIMTFAQLADTEVGQIEAILEAENPRLRQLADPSTWPEQASLAAAGEWEALEALQGELRGGRRA
jgi:predicted flap endonuclease-1-like 5' DNA nuclease